MKLSSLFEVIEDCKDGPFCIALRTGDEDCADQVFNPLNVEVMKTADGWMLIFEVDE